ncbi:hypothetical protein D3C80_1404780 [compost metagenome]
MGSDDFPFDRSTEHAADAAHLPIHRGRFVAGLQPGRANLLQVAAGDGVDALGHDHLEVVGQCVGGLLVASMVRLKPGQVGVGDEVAQRGQGRSPATL